MGSKISGSAPYQPRALRGNESPTRPVFFTMSYTLGRTWLIPKKLTAAGAVAYLQKLNRKGHKIYDPLRIRATEADTELVGSVVQRYGNFRLCLLPYIYFTGRQHTNIKRVIIVRKLFQKNKNTLSKIPPIVVSDYKQKIFLLDGSARAEVAFELKIPLLGYVPENLISSVKGIIII